MRNKIKYLPIMILTLVTALSAVGLSSTRVMADITDKKDASVTVETTCTFTNASDSYTYSLSVSGGNSGDTTGWADTTKAPFTMSCNDLKGFKVNAIGYSNDTLGNTNMIGTNGTIATGTSGADSYWAFRVSALSATGTTVDTNYGATDTWYAIPGKLNDDDTVGPAIASFAATNTGATVTGSVRTDYKVFVAGSQAAGTYTGKVKYTLVQNS